METGKQVKGGRGEALRQEARDLQGQLARATEDLRKLREEGVGSTSPAVGAAGFPIMDSTLTPIDTNLPPIDTVVIPPPDTTPPRVEPILAEAEKAARGGGETVPAPATPSEKAPAAKTTGEELKGFITELNLEPLLPTEFGGLEEGEKLKVILDLKRRIVDIVKSDAQTQYSESLKGKVGKSFKGFFRKKIDEKVFEKKVFEELKNTETGREIIRKDLEVLTRNVQGKNIGKIEHKKDGSFKVEIQYLGILSRGFGSATPEERQTLNQFNSVANTFAQMPYEWGQERKGKHKKEYDKAQAEYVKARNEVLRIQTSKERPEDKGRATMEMLQTDTEVQMEQLLNTHPEFEQALNDFTTHPDNIDRLKNAANVINDLSGRNWTNRLLTIGGVGARMAARGAAVFTGATGITFLAAPAIGGVVGWYRGKYRGKETLSERQKQARHGQKDESAEAKNTVSAENLSERLSDIMKAFVNAATPGEKAKKLDQIKRRIEYTENKIGSGLVNFGNAKAALNNQYNLINSLNSASIISSSQEETTRKDIDKRLERFLSYRTRKIDAAQNAFIREQAQRGAILGAGLATVGYGARWFGEHMGWWGHHAETVTQKPGSTPTDAGEGFMARANRWMDLIKGQKYSSPTLEDIKQHAPPFDINKPASLDIPEKGLHWFSPSEKIPEDMHGVRFPHGVDLSGSHPAEVGAETPAVDTTMIDASHPTPPAPDTIIDKSASLDMHEKGLHWFNSPEKIPKDMHGVRFPHGVSFGDTHSGAGTLNTAPPAPGAAVQNMAEQNPVNSGDLHQIHRDAWYDNNTSNFDKNELQTHWGGEHGTGINSDGKIVLDLSHMTQGGSAHGELSANAKELIEQGKLKMLISLSRGTQNQVFEVPINSEGQAVIDPGSEVGKAFTIVDGHVKFTGGFAEVGQDMGKEHFRILSTIEGGGGKGVVGQVATEIPKVHTPETNVINSPDSVKFPPPHPSNLENLTPLQPDVHHGAPEVPSPKIVDTTAQITAEEIARAKVVAGMDAAHSSTVVDQSGTEVKINGEGVGGKNMSWQMPRGPEVDSRSIGSPGINTAFRGGGYGYGGVGNYNSSHAAIEANKWGGNSGVYGNAQGPMNVNNEHYFSGLSAEQSHILSTHPEFADNPLHLANDRLIQVYETYQHGLARIFPGNQIDFWKELRDLKAEKVIGNETYENNHAYDSMMHFLHKLMDLTHTEPKGRTGLFHGPETTQKFLIRALQEAAKQGKLADAKNLIETK